jgi:hypothetical protein
MNNYKIVKIQGIVRGFLYRIKHLPLILYKIKAFLQKSKLSLTSFVEDGRINSSLDEKLVTNSLKKEFNQRIKIPKDRFWYDIQVYDKIYGWLPVNIKITTTKTSDNAGNLAICVQSYTNEILDMNKTYDNNKMSEILFRKIQNKEYNRIYKKDYYFIVLNKLDNTEIIINSVLGLNKLTPNSSNLPFQIKWNTNKEFCYNIINKKIKMLVDCLKKPKLSWQEHFMSNMRTLKI